jgi:hypothetical protein
MKAPLSPSPTRQWDSYTAPRMSEHWVQARYSNLKPGVVTDLVLWGFGRLRIACMTSGLMGSQRTTCSSQ